MKTRLIHTKFWTDNFILSLLPEEKLIFTYLITNEHVNILALYECSDQEIVFTLGITDVVLRQAKQKFEEADKIYFYKGFVCLKNAGKYENYVGELHDKARENLLKQINPEILAWQKRVLEAPLKPPSNPLEAPLKGSINNNINNTNNSNNSNIVKNVTSLVGSNIVTPEPGDKETPDIETRETKHGNAVSLSYLLKLPEEDVKEFMEKFSLPSVKIVAEAEKAADWLRSKGRQQKDYKAYFRNWLRNVKERQDKEQISNYYPYADIKFTKPKEEQT